MNDTLCSTDASSGCSRADPAIVSSDASDTSDRRPGSGTTHVEDDVDCGVRAGPPVARSSAGVRLLVDERLEVEHLEDPLELTSAVITSTWTLDSAVIGP